jgi:uncharacterized repeat protein (TIGR01451 family)
MVGKMQKSLSKTRFALALAISISSGTIIAPGQVHAQAAAVAQPVTLTSDVKIERVEVDASGKEKITLYTPKDVAVVPGDKVVFTLEVVNTGNLPAAGFRATNPMPGAVQFASVAEDWAEVSVDGGKGWGKLGALKVRTKDSQGATEVERAAGPEDVTHVRWVFAEAIAPGASRKLSYRGVVK